MGKSVHDTGREYRDLYHEEIGSGLMADFGSYSIYNVEVKGPDGETFRPVAYRGRRLDLQKHVV